MYWDHNQTISFNITNTGNDSLTLNASLPLNGFSPSYWSEVISLDSNESAVRSLNISADDDTDVGPHTITLSILDTSNSSNSLSSSKTFNVYYPYCDNVDNATTNPIRLDELRNQNKIEDEDFNLLDSIFIKVKVQNLDDDDSQYGVVEALIVQGTEVYDDYDAKKKIKIDEDDTETFYLNLTVSPDLDEGTAYLYIKVYNDDDEDNCEQLAIPINIKKSTREVIPFDLSYPESVTCGETFTIEGDVYNIGEKDEDKVKMTLKAFSNLYDDEFNNLDSGEDGSFLFNVKVPMNASEGTNKMVFTLYYDYDEDSELFDESEYFNYNIKVENCRELVNISTKTESSTAITSTASELRFLVSNDGASTQNIAVSASADWATIESISPSSFSLEAGKEQYVSIMLTPNKNTEIGLHSLNVKVAYASELDSIAIPVNVQRPSTPSGLFDKIAFYYKYDTMWAVLDSLLIIAIIIVSILLFMAKRKS